MTRTIATTLMLLLLQACTTARDSILLGAGVGLTTGAAVGAAAGQSDHNEMRAGAVGAVTGALLGGLMGYLAHKDDEAQAAARKNQGGDVGPSPSLTRPVVRRVWVPDQVEGEKLIRGHYIYLIEKNSVWRAPDER